MLSRCGATTDCCYGWSEYKRMGPVEDRHKMEHSAAKAMVFRSHHPTYQPRKRHPRTEGLRGRGMPPTSWMNDIRALTGGSVVQATRLVSNRFVWRALVSATPVRVCALRPTEAAYIFFTSQLFSLLTRLETKRNLRHFTTQAIRTPSRSPASILLFAGRIFMNAQPCLTDSRRSSQHKQSIVKNPFLSPHYAQFEHP